jgi:hypothetical protein
MFEEDIGLTLTHLAQDNNVAGILKRSSISDICEREDEDLQHHTRMEYRNSAVFQYPNNFGVSSRRQVVAQ